VSERLFQHDSRRVSKQESLQKELYQECTFQPKINPISDKIAPSLTVQERY